MRKLDLKKKDRGATFVEYAVLVALIAVVTIGAVKAVGAGVSGAFSTVESNFDSAINP